MAEPGYPDERVRPRAGGSILAAAMLAVGEIIEPEKVGVDIEQRDDRDDEPDLGLQLEFGGLPPLN